MGAHRNSQRTEAGQLLVEMVYNNVVTALRMHPAAGIGFIPIPCFYDIMIMSSYAKVSGDHPWDFGSKAREPLILKAPCFLIYVIIYPMSEHDEQSAFFEAVGYMKNPALRWLHAIPNGGARNVVVATRMKQEGVKRGVWDVFLPYPCGGYHGLYIEFKYGNNKLTPEQKEFGEYLVEHGYKTGVAHSADEALEILNSYLRG